MTVLRWLKRKLRRRPHRITVVLTADASQLEAALAAHTIARPDSTAVFKREAPR